MQNTPDLKDQHSDFINHIIVTNDKQYYLPIAAYSAEKFSFLRYKASGLKKPDMVTGVTV
ncbi:MAG: hypothetical protein JWP37_2565 [Mucilaginibacter sp.]|nr:hypothetical protein [Mucilaginibacter sp.]